MLILNILDLVFLMIFKIKDYFPKHNLEHNYLNTYFLVVRIHIVVNKEMKNIKIFVMPFYFHLRKLKINSL